MQAFRNGFLVSRRRPLTRVFLPVISPILRCSATNHRRDDVTRQVVIQLRGRKQAGLTSKRRIVAHNEVEFVLGFFSTLFLGGAVVFTFLSTDAKDHTLSVKALVTRDPQVLASSLFVHENAAHLVFNLFALLPSGIAAAAAPTYLYRWAAIPVVFLLAGVASSAAQLIPDLFTSCEALPGGTVLLRKDLDESFANLLRSWDVPNYVSSIVVLWTGMAARLRDNPRILDQQKTRIYGAAGGALGLATFASLEWAVGGARVWPALLLPAILLVTGAGRILAPSREPPQQSAFATISPALATTLAGWRPPPGSGLRGVEANVGGGVGDASGLLAGAACWVASRGLRGGIIAMRFIFSTMRMRVSST